MKKVIKGVFVLLLVFCSCVFTSIYIMEGKIYPNYKISSEQEFKIDALVPVTAVYNGQKISQGMYARRVGEQFDVDLKLFGVIPFSTVSVEIVDDMHVKVLGEPFGMKVYTNGVLVVDAKDITTKDKTYNPAKDAGIKVGDYIKTVNGKTITCNEDLLQLVTESGGSTMIFEVIRNNKTFTCEVTPAFEKDTSLYRIGIWVRDSSAGVGTLTFYSPTNQVVCGLGHGICDSDTESLLQVYNGELVKAEIVDVEKGSDGNPGALKGKLSYDVIADISLNCEQGVYGAVTCDFDTANLTEIALKQSVKDGPAQIYCTVNGSEPKFYDCEIKKTKKHGSKTQNLIVTITDQELIEATGGIVQGMSGSPILQDGKLVGALTHVLVNDCKTGYGIYAENMLEVAENLAKTQLKQAS